MEDKNNTIIVLLASINDKLDLVLKSITDKEPIKNECKNFWNLDFLHMEDYD